MSKEREGEREEERGREEVVEEIDCDNKTIINITTLVLPIANKISLYIPEVLYP